MIYIFDKKQAIIKVLTNDDFTAAHLNFKINTAITFEFSLPASKALPSGSKYVATPHPLNDSKFIMLRLTERVDNTETIDYSAYELAYQELATDGYIEDKRPQNQSALNLMKIALDGSNWELNNVNVSGTAATNFYYVDRLSAISKVVDLLGGEIVFYIEIQGNAISGRYMDYLARQGADTSKVFASGSNLLTVERQSDTSGIYTAILPRGKGKEIDNGEADTPDGYGRRINIADVEWKKSAGKPLDKPKGSIVLSDPDATAEWGQINGNARLLLQTYDDIDDVNVLINSAYKTLQSVNHPQIQYSATVADVGGLSLGDTVLIMHGDRDLSYKTRVFEVKYDLLSPDQTELSLGDDLSSNSITSQLNSLNAVADTTSSQTQWTINQIGRPGTTYGATAPDSPKVGDIWFKYLADGGTEIYRWNGDIWELLASPTTADDIAAAVDDAVTQAKEHVEEVKQGLSSDIATAKSQATSLANAAVTQANAHTATAIEQNNVSQQEVMNDIAKSQVDLAIKDGDFNNKAQAMADEALANAKANTATVAQDTLNSANQNIAAAKSDLTDGLQKEVSDRTSAVTALDTKAQGYVDTAKSDINDTINALSVGGRNYLLNSNGSTLSLWTPVSGWQVVSDSIRGNAFSFTPTTTWTGGSTNSISQSRTDFTTEKNVTVSFWAKASVDGAKFHSEPTGGNTAENSSFNITLTTTWKRYSYTFVLKTNRVYFIPVDAGTIYYLDDLQLETGNMMSDYKQAPEDVVLDYTTKDNKIKETITQYQETNDGYVSKAQTDATTALGLVEKKVSLTVYNQKTGELSEKINDVKDTADSSAQTIADIQEADGKRDSRISEVEHTAGEIKSTVSDLTTAQGEQSGYISTLKQRADEFDATVTKVDNLSVGGRNYLISGTAALGWLGDNSVIGHNGAQGIVYDYISTTAKEVWSYSVWSDKQYTVTSEGKYLRYALYDSNKQQIMRKSIGLNISTDTAKGQIVVDDNSSVAYIRVSIDWVANGYGHAKLEKGNLATDYSQAPEDINSATAKAQLTADNASAAISKLTSADGIITKAQADIRANADAITKTVSKTVYDQNTGDLNQAISKAQSTAESAVSTVGNYQTSNDKRVGEAESKIEQNANDITARVIKTDYDNNNSQLNTRFTKVEATADGAATTVGELQKTVNNLGQINQLINTEFSPDFQGWIYENEFINNNSFSDPSSFMSLDPFKYQQSNIANISISSNGYVMNNPIPLSKAATKVTAKAMIGLTTNNNGSAAIRVRAYDVNKKIIANSSTTEATVGTSLVSFQETLDVPSGAAYIGLVITFSGTVGGIRISQPILVFDSNVGNYSQGNYNNNNKVATQQVKIDGITNIVSNPTTGLSVRVQTAEGTLSTVKSTADGAMSKASQTANDITQEIKDRDEGDSNTLQSSKEFTQSSITSSEFGMNSVISQTANGILAKVESKNLVYNSEFDPLNYGWYKITGKTAGSAIGDVWTATVSTTFVDRPIVSGSRLVLYTSADWISSNLSSAMAGISYSASIIAGRFTPSVTTVFDIRIGFWDSNKKLISISAGSEGMIGNSYKDMAKYSTENRVSPTGTAYVSLIIVHSNGNVNDVIGRPMLSSGATAVPYTPTTATTSSSTIISLFKDNWSIGISDNIGNITSGIVGNPSSMSLIGKNITLDGNTTFTALKKTVGDTDSAVSQVKNTADSISNFVRDSSGNISSNFQTALSKTSIVSGSTLATSIKTQTATQISSALMDNNGKIISLINQDASGVQIAGKNIVLNGDTTVTGDFYARGGNFQNLNASNIKVGTLDGYQVNIANLNASNITTGNLTGVQIGITNGGKFYANQLGTIYDFSDNPYYYSNQASGNTDPWIRINQNGVYNLGSDGTRLSISGTVTAADAYIGSTKQYAWYTQSDAGIQSGTNRLKTSAELGMTGLRISQEDADHPEQTGGYSFITGHGMYVGYNQNNPRFSVNTTGTVYADTIKLIGGRSWQSINGASTDVAKLQQGQDLQFYVGSSDTLNLYSNKGNVSLKASGRWLVEGRSNGYIYLGNVKWTSGGTSVQMATDGALTALSSSIKYKTNIEYDKDGAAGEKLLTLDPMTWQDKSDNEEIKKYKETGIKPDHKIDLSNRRYYGMLAEDFDKAGLDDFVLKDEETGELHGIQYEKIGAALIPIIRNMRKMILEQQVEIERLKEK